MFPLLTKPPTSYASRPYYAIHAYKWVDAEGGERYVRYTWLPAAEEPYLSMREAKRRGRDYLREEIAARLDKGPAHLDLQLQIAAEGDETDDPASQWPQERERVIAGTLELTAVAPDPESDGNIVEMIDERNCNGREDIRGPERDTRGCKFGINVDMDAWQLAAFIWASGGQTLTDDLTGLAWDQEPAIRAIQFMADLVNVHKVAPLPLDPSTLRRRSPDEGSRTNRRTHNLHSAPAIPRVRSIRLQ